MIKAPARRSIEFIPPSRQTMLFSLPHQWRRWKSINENGLFMDPVGLLIIFLSFCVLRTHTHTHTASNQTRVKVECDVIAYDASTFAVGFAPLVSSGGLFLLLRGPPVHRRHAHVAVCGHGAARTVARWVHLVFPC